jgi:hypothetical protein
MDCTGTKFLSLAWDLEQAGLLWQPAIGDEISNREQPEVISILVDPQGMTPTTLRDVYLWLPTIEQLILQLEYRQAVLYHAGLELTERVIQYKAVIKTPGGQVEGQGESLRSALGVSLRDLLRLSKMPLQ